MSDVESLVTAIAKVRRDWPRAEIRAAIADAVAVDLYKLALDPTAVPGALRSFIQRRAHDLAAAALVSSAPPVDHVLDPTRPAVPPPGLYREAREALRRTP
jgi:hypothetical protein